MRSTIGSYRLEAFNKIVIGAGRRRCVPLTRRHARLPADRRPESVPLARVAPPLGHLLVAAVLVWRRVGSSWAQKQPLAPANGRSRILLKRLLFCRGHGIIGARSEKLAGKLREALRIYCALCESLAGLAELRPLRVLGRPWAYILCYLRQKHAILLGFLLNMELGSRWELSFGFIGAWSWCDQCGVTLLTAASLQLGIRHCRINSYSFAFLSKAELP